MMTGILNACSVMHPRKRIILPRDPVLILKADISQVGTYIG